MIEVRRRTRDLLLVWGSLTLGGSAVAETPAPPAERPTETAQPVEKTKVPLAASPKDTIPEKVAEPGVPAEPPKGPEPRSAPAVQPRVSPELLDAYRKAQEALRSAQELEGRAKLQNLAKAVVAASGGTTGTKDSTPPALPADVVEKIAEARAHAARELALAREKLKDARIDKLTWKPTPEERVKIVALLETRLEERKADRAERAETERAKIEKRLGEALERPVVQTELKRHAWRVARLRQIVEISEAAGKKELAERARLLLEEETTAHDKRLAELSTQDDDVTKLPAAAKVKAAGGAPPPAPNAATAPNSAPAPNAAAPQGQATEGAKK